MTGQSVAFEQKFNYRRPMYIVMDYLWQIEEQVECFRQVHCTFIVICVYRQLPTFVRNLFLKICTRVKMYEI